MRKVFVGGLNWATTSEELARAFERFGRVKQAQIVTDRETKRSKGFGFVTFELEDDVDVAIRDGHGRVWDGRTIRVTEAEERPRVSSVRTHEKPQASENGYRPSRRRQAYGDKT